MFSDPDFPSSLKDPAAVAKVKLFSQFFKTYTGLEITNPTDLPLVSLP